MVTCRGRLILGDEVATVFKVYDGEATAVVSFRKAA
ncbi:MAG: hypothetical protein JWO20_206 [Candidatus Angelobacter sp.]|jgi:hypothetical protein|nr:hypothetical protein [Candidatus Angelobacter sp.]